MSLTPGHHVPLPRPRSTWPCDYLLDAGGGHRVACGLPSTVVLWWKERHERWDLRMDLPACLPHAHAAARDYPGARWLWHRTQVFRPLRGA